MQMKREQKVAVSDQKQTLSQKQLQETKNITYDKRVDKLEDKTIINIYGPVKVKNMYL